MYDPTFQSQKSHTKSASDVRFMGQTSSLLITAGHSTGDQNVVLWDTLLPQSKAMVHSFVGHPDGATCALYLSSSQVNGLKYIKQLSFCRFFFYQFKKFGNMVTKNYADQIALHFPVNCVERPPR